MREYENTQVAPKRKVTALDGLRVLAIIGVVVYHANPSWLPGGFLGVTVFFVISGYVITSSVLKELQNNDAIDFKAYICKRVRRLWPTMLIVVLATALLSAIFAPALLQKMQPDVLPALAFFDNWWYLIQNLSYFSASGQPSPLTHFWYVAVIMQFYIVWPLVMLLVWRLSHSKRLLGIAAAILMFVSVGLMIFMHDPAGDNSRVYYGTDTRAAELMMGAWLAFAVPLGKSPFKHKQNGAAIYESTGKRVAMTLVGNYVVADILGAIALAAIIFMAFVINGFSVFLYQGGLLLVAALTAMTITAVNNPKSLLGKVLGLRPLQVAGARSYAVYMWHYPLLLCMNPATRTTELPWWGWVIEFAVIVAVSEASYRIIEKHTNSGQIGEFMAALFNKDISFSSVINTYRVPIFGAGIVVLASVALLIVGPFWAYNEINHITPEKTTMEKIAEMDIAGSIWEAEYGVDETGICKAKVLLIGDSVARGAEENFIEIFPNGYIDAVVGRQLYLGNSQYEAAIESGYTPDIVVYALGNNGMATEEQVRENIDVCGDVPVYLVNNRVPQNQQDLNNSLFAEVAAQYSNVQIIDWYSESTGHDEYFWDDGTHLRPEGAEAYVLMLRRYVAGE